MVRSSDLNTEIQVCLQATPLLYNNTRQVVDTHVLIGVCSGFREYRLPIEDKKLFVTKIMVQYI